MLNPCHASIVTRFCNLTFTVAVRNYLSYLSEKHLLVPHSFNWFFRLVSVTSFLGLLFPETSGLDLPFEVFFFFLEHFLPIFVFVYQFKYPRWLTPDSITSSPALCISPTKSSTFWCSPLTRDSSSAQFPRFSS